MEAGLNLADLIDYRLGRAYLLLARGRILQSQGVLEEACTNWRQARQLGQDLENSWLQARTKELITRNCLDHSSG